MSTMPRIPKKVLPKLARRETQILKLILAEYSQIEICRILNIHPNTVSSTKRSVMNKWDVRSTIGLVKEAIKRGYLELEEDEILDANLELSNRNSAPNKSVA